MNIVRTKDFKIKDRDKRQYKNKVVQLKNKKEIVKVHSKVLKNKVIHLRDVPREIDDTWDWFVRMGYIDGNEMPVIDYNSINNMLLDKPIAVIGSGFSGRELNWKNLKNIKTLGINHIIELYHNLDFLIFQDHRFLRLNKYPLHKFKGRIFVANSNPAYKKRIINNIYPFIPLGLHHEPSKLIEKGLYARKSTGLCALNLALVLGANPIYLIGLDNPKDWEKSFTDYNNGAHIHKNYLGSVNTKKALDGYTIVLKYFKKFIPYKNRIINVCENGIMDWFKQISIQEFNKIIK